ncbi:hypothetical protein [Clostridium sp.]|nr:hypothetical protein [Clostridium sp.]
MKELLTEITQNFITSKSLPFKNNPMGKLFRNTFPSKYENSN